MDLKENSDGEKPMITKCTICIIILASLVLSILIQFPYHCIANATLKDCFEFSASLFSTFSLAVIGWLGLNIVSIRKQGSKYYPREYGKRKLDAVIKSILIDFDFVMLWNDFNFYKNFRNLKRQVFYKGVGNGSFYFLN